YQAGTMSAGNYTNTSFTFTKNSNLGEVASAALPGSTTSETWTQSDNANVVLGGVHVQTSTATYAYDSGGGVSTLSNNVNASTDGPISTALVKFSAPDSNLIPLAGAAANAASPLGAAGASSGDSAPVPAAVAAPVAANINPEIAGNNDWLVSADQGAQA